jgi:hypothetical protein
MRNRAAAMANAFANTAEAEDGKDPDPQYWKKPGDAK